MPDPTADPFERFAAWFAEARAAESDAEAMTVATTTADGHKVTVIAGKTDAGVLYGAFAFLRLIQTRQSIASLDLASSPRLKVRIMDHWDNLNGTIKGYDSGNATLTVSVKEDGQLVDKALTVAKEAKIDGAVHAKAHTRFNLDWAWNGEEAMLMSRTTDETGDVQPSLAELTEHWGMKLDDWKDAERPRAIHMNAIQPWKIARDGSITDAMFI